MLSVQDLCKYFHLGRHLELKAVDHVSFDIFQGETVGLVGESGCGKTTTGRAIVKLHEPTSGKILYRGSDIFKQNKAERLEYCGNVQMIFQNPYASLNSRMTVSEIVGEGMKIHGQYSKKQQEDRVLELLQKVGLGRDHMSRFAHEFSGGQRQRIGIARALSVNPEFIVCDEPVSALDVSIQAQVINMLKKLQEELGLTYLFIAHDLSVVRYISDRVIVMYLGGIVEEAPADELYRNPQHPYTKVLLSAIPIADPDKIRSKERIAIKGEIPSPINLGDGCRFADRCPYALERCKSETPQMKELAAGHRTACHLL
jgi:oligopeptide transport system ATP-binding protein